MIKTYDDILQQSRANLDAAIQSGATMVKGVQDLHGVLAAYTTRSLDQAATAMKSYQGCKSPAEAIDVGTRLGRSAWEDMVTHTKHVADMQAGIVKTAMEPIGARYREMLEAITPRKAA